jgi:hypothetical protein
MLLLESSKLASAISLRFGYIASNQGKNKISAEGIKNLV